MILVWMRQQRHVDVAIPGRDTLVEALHQQVGVRATVDEQPRAVRCFEQDGVALTDVEDAHRQRGGRSGHQRDRRDSHQHHRRKRWRQASSARLSRWWRGLPGPRHAWAGRQPRATQRECQRAQCDGGAYEVEGRQ